MLEKFIYRNHKCICHWRGQCIACGTEKFDFENCFHDWKGPVRTIGNSASGTCSKCGAAAKDYYEAHPMAIASEEQS